jgi:hypothetical protein
MGARERWLDKRRRELLPTPYVQWNRQRERWMAEKVLAHRTDAENAIVICGFDHLGPLAALLEASGIQVCNCGLPELPLVCSRYFCRERIVRKNGELKKRFKRPEGFEMT